jgi:hypothetical protein
MTQRDARPKHNDPFISIELFLVRLKFVIFEIVMLICFLVVLYKVLGHELGF